MVRALPCHGRGCGFEPRRVRHSFCIIVCITIRHFSPSSRTTVFTTLTRGFFLASGVAIFLLMIHLAWRLFFELQGALNPDYPIYWAMGKGILHGLQPYADLFETKPPGVFLLSALSWKFTDGPYLLHASGVLAILSIPVIICTAARERYSTAPRIMQILCGLASLLFGLSVALVIHKFAAVQPETFGACFGILFLYVFLTSRITRGSVRVALASLCLWAAIFMKEPFLLSMVGGVLIISPLLRTSILGEIAASFVCALLLDIAILFSLGYLHDYLWLYLPMMLSQRINSLPQVIDQATNIGMVLGRFEHFGPVIVLLILSAAWLKILSDSRCALHKPASGAFSFLMFFLPVGSGIALLLTSMSMGGSNGNHLIFAMPGFVALFFLVLGLLQKEMELMTSRVIPVLLIGLLMWWCAGLRFPDVPPTFSRLSETTIAPERIIAQEVDDILDRCDIDRYLYIGQGDSYVYGLTSHSPLGPVFFYHMFIVHDKALVQTILPTLSRASLVLIQEETFVSRAGERQIYQQVLELMKPNFSPQPWACAGDVSPVLPKGYRLSFRNADTDNEQH